MSIVKISIICPVRNEQHSLSLLYERLKIAMSGYLYEIIFIDDASTDQTFDILSGLIDNTQSFVVRNSKRQGQCASIVRGIQRAQGGIVVLIDGDLQFFPEDIPMMVSKLTGNVDLVSGVRVKRMDNMVNRFYTSGLIFFSKLFFNLDISDTSGFIVVKRALVDSLPLVYNDHRYLLLILHGIYSISIKEVNIQHVCRQFGRSKYSFFKGVWAVPEFVALLVRFYGGFYHKIY